MAATRQSQSSNHKLQLINEEEEKKNIQNFLDDDIEQIDNFLNQGDDGEEISEHYNTINQAYNSQHRINTSKERNVVKRRRTDQNLASNKNVSSQFLHQM